MKLYWVCPVYLTLHYCEPEYILEGDRQVPDTLKFFIRVARGHNEV